MMRPKPRHVSHAPSGLLNENRFGVGVAHREAAARRTRARSRSAAAAPPSSGRTTAARPRPWRNACSSDSTRRPRSAARSGQPVLDHGRATSPAGGAAERPRAGRRPPAPSTRTKPAPSRPSRACAHGRPAGSGQLEDDQGAGAGVRGEQVGGGALGRCRACTGRAALAAVQHADLGEQQLQVVVQLGHRADGRARRLDGPALVDRDRRQDAVDALDAAAAPCDRGTGACRSRSSRRSGAAPRRRARRRRGSTCPSRRRR